MDNNNQHQIRGRACVSAWGLGCDCGDGCRCLNCPVHGNNNREAVSQLQEDLPHLTATSQSFPELNQAVVPGCKDFPTNVQPSSKILDEFPFLNEDPANAVQEEEEALPAINSISTAEAEEQTWFKPTPFQLSNAVEYSPMTNIAGQPLFGSVLPNFQPFSDTLWQDQTAAQQLPQSSSISAEHQISTRPPANNSCCSEPCVVPPPQFSLAPTWSSSAPDESRVTAIHETPPEPAPFSAPPTALMQLVKAAEQQPFRLNPPPPYTDTTVLQPSPTPVDRHRPAVDFRPVEKPQTNNFQVVATTKPNHEICGGQPQSRRTAATTPATTTGAPPQQTAATTSGSGGRQRVRSRIHRCTFNNCDKAFDCASHLRRHIRTHVGDKPFACPFDKCPKSFAQVGDLNRHKMTHTGCRPFKCSVPGCTKSFTRLYSMNRHTRTHHNT